MYSNYLGLFNELFLKLTMIIIGSKLIIMRLLTTFVGFLKSRDKILIKRRKIRLKNRPMSKKRLEQQQKVMNISYETKLMEIKKQMDRKKSPNHHLNEIIEELFYPQIQLSNQKEVDLRVKQISNESSLKEEQWESLVMMDELQEQLQQNSLPLQFLQLHQEKHSQFSSKHYMLMLSRLNYYCYNKARIQQQRMQNWKKILEKMKTKDQKLKQQAKCPYLFLEREEIPRHQFWLNIIEQIKVKMQDCQTIEAFNDYLPVLLLIQRTFNYVPAQLYQLAINKNSSTQFQRLSSTDISLLIKLLKCRNKIKYNPNIKIESPTEDMPKQYNHAFFARKIAAEVIQHPEKFTIEDLSNLFKIINSRKRRMNILSQDQFPKIQKIIQTFLNDLNFENVQTFFSIYCTLNQNPNLQFIQIIKFDLFRKAQTYLINRIRGRQLIFKNYQPNGVEPKLLRLQGYELLLRLGEVITKKFDQMKAHQLIQVLDAYFDNDVKNQSLIQILSTEIVRKGSEYSLQILGKSLFKLTLLGYRSKILTKFVFQNYFQKYHQEMKRYKDQGVLLLPTEDKVQSLPMDFKQIYLQECLLMTLWSVNKQLGDHLPEVIKLDHVLQLIPVKIESADPLALELTLNINTSLKKYSLFPKITNNNTDSANFPLGRLKEFYRHQFSKTQIQILMEGESKKTQLFTANFNQKDNKFLKERWSQKNVYDIDQYISFCKDKIQSVSTAKGNCFFDSQLILSDLFLKRRAELIGKMLQEKQLNNSPSAEVLTKKQKIYELLI